MSSRVTATDERLWLDLLQRASEIKEEGDQTYISLTTRVDDIDPLLLVSTSLSGERFYWAAPDRSTVIGAVGAVRHIEAMGERRFELVRRHLSTLRFISNQDEGPKCERSRGALVYGGFAFLPAGTSTTPLNGHSHAGLWKSFPDALLTLPEYTLTRRPDGTWLTQTTCVSGDLDPTQLAYRLSVDRGQTLARLSIHRSANSPLNAPYRSNSIWDASALAPHERNLDAWTESVQKLARAAEDGCVDKTVLARHVRIPLSRPCNMTRLLATLEQEHKQSYIFAVARGSDAFIGATPERLVDVDGERVRTAALAGSTKRGADAAEDRSLAERLHRSAKNRREHEIVRRWLLDRLGPWCTTIDAAAEPTVVQYPNVQHLYTPVTAELRHPTHILNLIEALHPTPAVGGYPLREALELITHHESEARGWYAGPIGWLTPQGSGEMAVGIRSTLIRKRDATLFAGCGIVEGSEPNRELEESRIKLSVILGSLVRALQ